MLREHPVQMLVRCKKKKAIGKGCTFFTRRSRGCCVAISMMTCQQTDIIPHTPAVVMPAAESRIQLASASLPLRWITVTAGTLRQEFPSNLFTKWRKTLAVCSLICTYTLSDFSEADTSEQSLRNVREVMVWSLSCSFPFSLATWPLLFCHIISSF